MPDSTADTARWLEVAEAQGVAGAVRAAIDRGEPGLAIAPIGSARAIDGGPGSYLNRVYGFGFDSGDPHGVVDRIEAFYASRGRPVRIELSPYADPALLPVLRARRYGVEAFRDVLVRPLDEVPPEPPI